MGDDIERRLADATARLHRYQSTAARAEELAARCERMDAEIAALRSAHAIEEREVRRLDGLSLTRILLSLRGAREDRLARERAEADAARYRVVQGQARLDAVTRELEAARAQLRRLSSAQETYDAVLDEKARLLAGSDDPRGRRLVALAQEQGRLTEEAREVTEASEAARTALDALARLDRTLGSASAWSTYDTFLNGGLVGSMIKHDRLDQAARQAAHADRCLVVLRTEVADVDGAAPLTGSVAVDGLTRFVDVWFDNIFTDLAVRERIGRAKQNVAASIARVRNLLAELEGRSERTRQRLAAIDTARVDLLTGQ
jgi:multidrug efflux pump subunit AcrA (membrane-fusion protein)